MAMSTNIHISNNKLVAGRYDNEPWRPPRQTELRHPQVSPCVQLTNELTRLFLTSHYQHVAAI
jgi:hypothetical protein